jgi:hypothetical protein
MATGDKPHFEFFGSNGFFDVAAYFAYSILLAQGILQ